MHGGRRGRAASGLLIVALATGALPGVATARLVLRDPSARAITVEDIEGGRKRIVVCNDGERVARNVEIKFQRFALKRNGRPLPPREALLPTHADRDAVAPGRCIALHVGLRPRVTIDTGATSEGTLAITSTVGVARLPLTLGTADARSPVVPAMGEDATLALRVERRWSRWKLVDGGELAVRVTTPGREPALPPAGAVLGVIAAGTHRAVVERVRAEPRRDPDARDVWLVKVEVTSLERTGEYEGTLDLAAPGAEAVEMPVAVAVGDTWHKAAFWAVLGALCAYLAQLWLRTWRIRDGWRRRRTKLRRRYCDARDAPATPPIPGTSVCGPSSGRVDAYLASVLAAIKAAAYPLAFVDTSSDAYKGIVESLDLADRDAACLAATGDDGLRARLVALGEARSAVLTGIGEGDPTPACARRAEALLNVGELDVGEALALAERARRHDVYLRRWLELLARANGLRATWTELNGWNGADADRRVLVEAGVVLERARRSLFAAVDEAALARGQVEGMLDAVEHRLELLRKLLTEPSVETLGLMAGGPLLPMGEALTLEEPGPLSRAAARALGVLSALRPLVDVAALLFAVVIAIVAAVSGIFGDTFGGSADYLKAFLAGAGAQAIVTGLAETIGQMRDTDRAAATTTPPAPAEIAAPAG